MSLHSQKFYQRVAIFISTVKKRETAREYGSAATKTTELKEE
jgi:hypothetical protein